jgi:5-methylcytosine-specific restriction protein A
VADRLCDLGFTVRYLRNPNWTWDEIVLACALVEANGWRAVSQERSEAIKLSELLQSTAIHLLEGRASDFRNPAGVERKTGDLVSCLPGRRRTNGNRLDVEVVDAFRSRPAAMGEEAQAIEAARYESGATARTLSPTQTYPTTESMKAARSCGRTCAASATPC